ncbi:INSulin related [Caenorhabditis elegans]|uniref:INSulin related n=1 Tax=Caenorhabditis elegans TaxID=6239 RepID=O16588_CAEEL|nr:INSulin related [Caenorhabditis elegans]CCD69804.1 INSulin related [Caenorhabditis elegans]|eukprot:NP_508247.1 INSulin related [Caenorhabditis elegans]
MNTFFFLAVLLVFCSAEQMTAKKFSTKTSSPIPELQEVFATVAADEFPFHKANTQPLAIYLNISTPQDCIHKIFRMTISFCSQVECQNMEAMQKICNTTTPTIKHVGELCCPEFFEQVKDDFVTLL